MNTRLFAGVLFLFHLIGCSGLPVANQISVANRSEITRTHEIIDTPFFAQQRFQCGPAALATVLNRYGLDVTPELLVDQVYIPARRGSLPEEMTATARRHGMLAYPLQGSLADLISELAADHPVLVFQNLGLQWLPRWHFAVVIGYDLNEKTLILRSGTRRRWKTTMHTFMQTWSRAEFWGKVIVPPGEIPATAEPIPYLQATLDLEHTTDNATALPALQRAVQKWPYEPLVWLSLGNNRYAERDYASAEQAFRQAAIVAPQSADAWNNLAYALLERQCPRQAIRAANCALQQDSSSAYQNTKNEISGRATGNDMSYCINIDCTLNTQDDIH